MYTVVYCDCLYKCLFHFNLFFRNIDIPTTLNFEKTLIKIVVPYKPEQQKWC